MPPIEIKNNIKINNKNSLPLVILLNALMPEDNESISISIFNVPPIINTKKQISADDISPLIG